MDQRLKKFERFKKKNKKYFLQKTGASIQVATEMLPSSTERAVTISGTCEALIDCLQEICQIFLEVIDLNLF